MKKERQLAEVFHPAVFIREEMQERGWSEDALAEKMQCKRHLVDEILAEKRNITLATATMLAQAFGTSRDFWLNLQVSYNESLKRK